MQAEETAPEGMNLYNIVSFDKHVDVDDKWWLEAVADDGTVISLGNLEEGVYEVDVRGPREPKGRYYRGGVGSPAHDRFTKYLQAYEELDGPPKGADTEATK